MALISSERTAANIPSLLSLAFIKIAYRANDEQLKKLPKELQEQIALLKEGTKYASWLYRLPDKPTQFIDSALSYPSIVESLIALSDKEEMKYWLKVASEEISLPLLKLFCGKNINWNEACEMSPMRERPLHLLSSLSKSLNVQDAVQAIGLLCKDGADIDCKNDSGYTPLHYAASESLSHILEVIVKVVKPKEVSFPIVHYLVEHGADINLQNDSY